MTPDLDRIIAGLSEAKRDAVLNCNWKGPEGNLHTVQPSILDRHSNLNRLGLAVRKRLQDMNDG